MPFRFHKIPGFTGLANRRDARDIGNGLSKAQNISLDVGGKIRTIGGLEDFTKVDGVTALTHGTVIAPGSGLFTYGSDHWRGTDTVVDLLAVSAATDSAVSDNYGEVDDVGGWTASAGTLTSEADEIDGIASNGTSFIFKMVTDVDDEFAIVHSAFTTAIGQRYFISADLYCSDADSMFAYVNLGGGVLYYLSRYTTAAWATFTGEFIALTASTTVSIVGSGNSGAKAYADKVYITKVPRRDLDTNWMALSRPLASRVSIYNTNDDSFTAALLDFGTVSVYTPGAGKIDFPTTNTFTDSDSALLNSNLKSGDVIKVSGCTTTTANNIAVVLERVIAGTATVRGNPFVVTAAEAGSVSLTTWNPTAFHYVNEALRASPAGGGINLRPKHYSFVDRTHFEGADSSERKFANWYANDVGPVAPTSASAHTTNGNVATQAELVAGTGFEVGITRTVDDGEWTAGTYIIAIAFKYDDGQISALYVPTTDEEFGTAILDGDSLTLTVRGKMSSTVNYDERISGGYVFCRKDESDDPWSLLTDISMAKGARATLSGTYNSWAESSTNYEAYTANFESIKLNLDSYESLAGIDPTTTVEVFTDNNAFWNASVIAGNRCFIFAPRYTDAGGNLQQFRDRIMYSQVNAYDTFPIDNIIDVVRGDAEDYVMGGIYGNDLLCFKQRTLYIIDISDPDPAGWQMKQDANKGKYPFRGIAHPGAYFETPVGPAWCNKFGVFLYNGSEIVPLLGDKIELSEHPLAYQRYMEFDGTNDYVTKSNDANLNFGAATDFSLEVIYRTSATTTGEIVGKGSTGGVDKRYVCYTTITGRLTFALDDATTFVYDRIDDLNDGEWHHGVGTFDRDGNVTAYSDGVAGGIPASIAAVGDIDDTNEPLAIGIQSTDLSTNPFDGDIALVRIWNRALTSAEVALFYAGQPVLAADQWGSGTELHDDGNAASDPNGNEQNDTTGWLAFNGTISSQADPSVGTYAIRNAATGAHPRLYWTGIPSPAVGKRFRVTFDAKTDHVGGLTANVFLSAAGAVTDDIGDAALTSAYSSHSLEVLITDATTDRLDIQFFGADNGDNCLVDNLSWKQIGCVAEYAPKGIGDATWEDQSTNSLDGTVVGATAIKEDSWVSFWTNYSILGYHALTNQIIVMRDCTGKWSSGQDYGDAFLIDLDTGAIITGRRVFSGSTATSGTLTIGSSYTITTFVAGDSFTNVGAASNATGVEFTATDATPTTWTNGSTLTQDAGIIFSNFVTDWNQELIIAEQFGTTVLLKKWTDEPQSQAVGLIDVRTADIDFGNPMFAKIFDALAAYYKSSAAQTTPFSYALDGDDRQTAWTRLTGNFTPEEFWEKLTLEPTAFECDTIRFKLDNPTAAGTMETNDLTIRYSEEPEDID